MKVVELITTQYPEFEAMSAGHLFSSGVWCSGYPDQLRRFFLLDENQNPLGGFVAYEGGRNGLKTLITPPFAPHIGLFVQENKTSTVKKNSHRKEVIEAIAEFLKSSKYIYYKLDFSPEWIDMQPMLWKKIHTTVRYTYRIDLKQTTEDIHSNLDSSKRNKISKATREGFSSSFNADTTTSLQLIIKNLSDKGISTHESIMKHILKLTTDGQTGFHSYTASDEKKLSVNICAYDHDIAYNLLSAVDRHSGITNAGTFSLYQSILKAKADGKLIFDFEGSGVPEIEEYFRSFGGSLVPYFSVSGGKKPWRWLMKWRQKS